MWPALASRCSVISSSILPNESTEISRSWRCRISTNRDMCVPLKLCGRFTYMLKFATVCCSPRARSLTLTGWIDVLDADLVDGHLPGVGMTLHILHGLDCRLFLTGAATFIFAIPAGAVRPDMVPKPRIPRILDDSERLRAKRGGPGHPTGGTGRWVKPICGCRASKWVLNSAIDHK